VNFAREFFMSRNPPESNDLQRTARSKDAPRHASGLRLLVPEWMGNYRRAWLNGDAIAGLTTAAVVIPKALAYATIAGLPVQVGLYTVMVPMAIYAVPGSSRPLSVSTTTSEGLQLTPTG
jgi:SulP family sulfate permease